MNLKELLKFALNSKASDIHLREGLEPVMRVDGQLVKTNLARVEHQDLSQLIYPILNVKQRQTFEAGLEVDFSFAIPDLSRVRANFFKHNDGEGLALRLIPTKILGFEELGLPAILKELSLAANGLILVTGPTGSGKSTTLSAMLDFINKTCQKHILTIEDPIEFLHASENSLVSQREVNRDTQSFEAALRAGLREDPDVILVGELRDIETIRLALQAAETGHLVLASLHTSSAAITINRIIDVFPGNEQNLVRTLLADTLRAVIAQNLVKKLAEGRVAAFEIMVVNHAIRNLIRESKIAQIYSCIQTGSNFGMQTMDQQMKALVTAGII